MHKNNRYFIASILLLFLVIVPVISLAEVKTELTYPTLPDNIKLTKTSDLSAIVTYFFVFAFLAAGIVSVIVIAVAAFKVLIYAGSPTKMGEARQRIVDVALGLLILMCSFIILVTINPDFITRTTIRIPLQEGFFEGVKKKPGLNYFDQSNHIAQAQSVGCSDYDNLTAVTTNESDIRGKDEDGNPIYDGLCYECDENADNPKLILNLWKGENFSGDATSAGMGCGDTLSLDTVKSLTYDELAPGVYFYNEPDCKGPIAENQDESFAQTEPGPIAWFADGSDQVVRSMRFINPAKDDNTYGVILTNGFQGGECSIPTISEQEDQCITIMDAGDHPQNNITTYDGQTFYPASAHVFLVDKTPAANPYDQGVTFRSSNLVYTVQRSQFNLQGGKMWKYDKDSPPTIITNHPKGNYNNDGNLDNLLYFFGSQANNNNDQMPDDGLAVPTDECLAFNPDFGPNQEAGVDFDCTDLDPDKAVAAGCHSPGKGYLSCVDEITSQGDYMVALYFHNEKTKSRQCLLTSGETFFYDASTNPPAVNLNASIRYDSISYRTYIITTPKSGTFLNTSY